MNFGVSSFVWVSPFSNETLWQFEHAKKLGFDFYEIAVEDPDKIDPDAIKREMGFTGMKAGVCGAFGSSRDISSADEACREGGKRYIRALIEIAAALKSPYVAGPMYAETGKARLADKKERRRQYRWARDNLREAADFAAQHNVRLALEPLNRFETDFINTTQQGLSFLKDVDRENVGLLLDTFHMNIEEKDIPSAIRAAGSKLYHFHACANDRGTPGEDHLPWVDIVSALREIGYDGSIVIEAFHAGITEIARAVSLWRPVAESPDTLAANGLRFLKDTFASTGKPG